MLGYNYFSVMTSVRIRIFSFRKVKHNKVKIECKECIRSEEINRLVNACTKNESGNAV